MVRKDDIEEKIAGLGDLSREQLIAAWQKYYGVDPPTGVRRELLTRAFAWQLQEKRFGGLSGEAKRLLRAAMRQAAKNLGADIPTVERSRDPKVTEAGASRRSVSTGARLVRDWNGKTHVVDVIETGFLFEGVRYRSLSGIARKITGANWSGPRFFGL